MHYTLCEKGNINALFRRLNQIVPYNQCVLTAMFIFFSCPSMMEHYNGCDVAVIKTLGNDVRSIADVIVNKAHPITIENFSRFLSSPSLQDRMKYFEQFQSPNVMLCKTLEISMQILYPHQAHIDKVFDALKNYMKEIDTAASIPRITAEHNASLYYYSAYLLMYSLQHAYCLDIGVPTPVNSAHDASFPTESDIYQSICRNYRFNSLVRFNRLKMLADAGNLYAAMEVADWYYYGADFYEEDNGYLHIPCDYASAYRYYSMASTSQYPPACWAKSTIQWPKGRESEPDLLRYAVQRGYTPAYISNADETLDWLENLSEIERTTEENIALLHEALRLILKSDKEYAPRYTVFIRLLNIADSQQTLNGFPDFSKGTNVLSLLEEAAHKGSARAAYLLGENYMQSPAKKKIAQEWYRKASEAGSCPAAYRLATEFYAYKPSGVYKDKFNYERYLLQAAVGGFLPAIHELIEFYRDDGQIELDNLGSILLGISKSQLEINEQRDLQHTILLLMCKSINQP